MERQVTLEEIVNGAQETLRASIYISMPGSVISYDHSTQTAIVQPMVNDVRFDLDTGEVVFEPWQPIHAVPVCWPRFGGFVVAGFLNQYDQVVLEAFDLDPGPWRAQGRSGQPVNPVDVRRLGGNYWRCVPTDLTGPIASAPSSPGMVIGQDGQVSQIVITPSAISLGAQASDFVALASKVETELGKIATTLGTLTVPIVGAAGVTNVVAGTPYTTPGPVAATLVKAQ